MTHPADTILIVDFGSQVTQLIARRVREAGVYCEIAPFSLAEAAFARLRPRGIILSGSPAGVPEEGSPRAPEALFASGLPILGICYGQQVMSHQLGGRVERGGGLTAITLFRTGQAAEGRLTLVFGDQPTELKQWVVVDAQARETRVSLYQPEYGGRFSNLLFDFNDPRFREELGIQ